jgi:hypothetical protein
VVSELGEQLANLIADLHAKRAERDRKTSQVNIEIAESEIEYLSNQIEDTVREICGVTS